MPDLHYFLFIFFLTCLNCYWSVNGLVFFSST